MSKLSIHIVLEDQMEIDAMHESMETIYKQGVCREIQRTQAKEIMAFLEPMVTKGEREG